MRAYLTIAGLFLLATGACAPQPNPLSVATSTDPAIGSWVTPILDPVDLVLFLVLRPDGSATWTIYKDQDCTIESQVRQGAWSGSNRTLTLGDPAGWMTKSQEPLALDIANATTRASSELNESEGDSPTGQ